MMLTPCAEGWWTMASTVFPVPVETVVVNSVEIESPSAEICQILTYVDKFGIGLEQGNIMI